MFKEFIIRIVSLAFFSSVCEMIMPNTTIKKYLKLAFGFVMIGVLLQPVSDVKSGKRIEFSFGEEVSNEEIQAKSEAYILSMHEENLRKYVKDKITNADDVFIELYADGRIRSVNIKGGNIPPTIIEELKIDLDCKEINVTGGEHGEN